MNADSPSPLFPQFLMVKFLCTRQDSAERLGVQQLAFNGYVCHDAERFGMGEELDMQLEEADYDMATSLTLIKKTLYFIQQLTRDMVTNVYTCFIHILKG